MNDKLIMEVFVEIQDRVRLDSPDGSIVMVPFTGNIKSELFNGTLYPTGVDTQFIDVNGIMHMSARYMAEGFDYKGEACKLYIENEGFIQLLEAPKPFKSIPKFYTDSVVLRSYLHAHIFRGEGHLTEKGVVIKFFEIGGKSA